LGSTVAKIGGWVAILDGFAAGYLASAIVLNVTLGREVLPLFPAKSRPLVSVDADSLVTGPVGDTVR
jgi:hypothetical protein